MNFYRIFALASALFFKSVSCYSQSEYYPHEEIYKVEGKHFARGPYSCELTLRNLDGEHCKVWWKFKNKTIQGDGLLVNAHNFGAAQEEILAIRYSDYGISYIEVAIRQKDDVWKAKFSNAKGDAGGVETWTMIAN